MTEGELAKVLLSFQKSKAFLVKKQVSTADQCDHQSFKYELDILLQNFDSNYFTFSHKNLDSNFSL